MQGNVSLIQGTDVKILKVILQTHLPQKDWRFLNKILLFLQNLDHNIGLHIKIVDICVHNIDPRRKKLLRALAYVHGLCRLLFNHSMYIFDG
jgi:hypothetical protein